MQVQPHPFKYKNPNFSNSPLLSINPPSSKLFPTHPHTLLPHSLFHSKTNHPPAHEQQAMGITKPKISLHHLLPCYFFSSSSSSSAAPIRLIASDGRVNLFDHPIPASYLMEQHPLHLICRSDSLFLGRKVPALSASDKLQPGHSYFLLPSHFFHSVLSFVTLVSSSSFVRSFDIEKTEKGMVRVRVKDEVLVDDGDVSRRKHFNTKEMLEDKRRLRVCDSEELEKECRQLVGCRLKEWKPRLETIMESSGCGCRRRSVLRLVLLSRRRKKMVV